MQAWGNAPGEKLPLRMSAESANQGGVCFNPTHSFAIFRAEDNANDDLAQRLRHCGIIHEKHAQVNRAVSASEFFLRRPGALPQADDKYRAVGAKQMLRAVASCQYCPQASGYKRRGCANPFLVSSSRHDERKSDIWSGMFLGGGRDFSDPERCYFDRGRLRRRDEGKSDIRRRLHGRDRPRGSRSSGVRSWSSQLRTTARCFLVESQSDHAESTRAGCRDAISFRDFLPFARTEGCGWSIERKAGEERAISPADRDANRARIQILARGGISPALSGKARSVALCTLINVGGT
jgi:hypothetical protein